MPDTPAPPRSPRGHLRIVGPGLVVAATGLGTGDLVSAARAGTVFGLPLLWTAVLGALLKYVVAEGIARWQLATDEPFLDGWLRAFGRPAQVYLLAYLILWSIIVAGALTAACGLAAHALVPQLPVAGWAVLHALLALAFVWFESYAVFERAMKIAVAVIAVALIGSALLLAPPPGAVLSGLFAPSFPLGAEPFILGAVGGAGGTLTLLSYSYWLREKGWRGPAWKTGARIDLGVGYLATGLFAAAVMLLAGLLLAPKGIVVSGSKSMVQMAQMLGRRFGLAGELVLLVGFWAALASAIMGVWQSVPSLFGNLVGAMRGARGEAIERYLNPRGAHYRAYAVLLTAAPILLLLRDQPGWLLPAYVIVGALFLPLLAITLLVLNNRGRTMGILKNGFWANAGLVAALLLFAVLAVDQLFEELVRWLG